MPLLLTGAIITVAVGAVYYILKTYTGEGMSEKVLSTGKWIYNKVTNTYSWITRSAYETIKRWLGFGPCVPKKDGRPQLEYDISDLVLCGDEVSKKCDRQALLNRAKEKNKENKEKLLTMMANGASSEEITSFVKQMDLS